MIAVEKMTKEKPGSGDALPGWHTQMGAWQTDYFGSIAAHTEVWAAFVMKRMLNN